MSDANPTPTGEGMRSIFAAMSKAESKPTLADAVASLQEVAEDTASSLRELLATILHPGNRAAVHPELLKYATQMNDRLKLYKEIA